VVADCERGEDGRMQLMATRRMVRTRVQTRSDGADAATDALPATEAHGVVSRVLLEAVSGGQPLLLTRRGRPAAVLCDPDTWAELEELASESLEASA
jgi:prevent-host-death family protein